MFSQHAKWLQAATLEPPWRRKIASLNYLLASHVSAAGTDNGFTHQDPGFLDHAINKSSRYRARLLCRWTPITLLSAFDSPPAQPALASLRGWSRAAATAPPQWLTMDQGRAVSLHGSEIGIWQWASNDQDGVSRT